MTERTRSSGGAKLRLMITKTPLATVEAYRSGLRCHIRTVSRSSRAALIVASTRSRSAASSGPSVFGSSFSNLAWNELRQVTWAVTAKREKSSRRVSYWWNPEAVADVGWWGNQQSSKNRSTSLSKSSAAGGALPAGGTGAALKSSAARMIAVVVATWRMVPPGLGARGSRIGPRPRRSRITRSRQPGKNVRGINLTGGLAPMSRFASLLAVVLLALAASGSNVSPAAPATEEGRLLRQPDIQGDRIVFVYGADLWTVARAGGAATRLTSHEGIERLPKFSPDGGTIAFTAEYDGNTDLFTVPAAGGEPKRLTWHPEADYATEWFPDGKSILIRSLRAAPTYRYDQFFKVPAEGGFEEPLPIPTGGYASISPDGGRIAFVAPAYDNRTWKRYTGGMAPDIWVYDLARKTSEKITDWQGADEWPMWYRGTIYYASDQGGKRANLWAYELETKKRRQVTQFQDDDVRSPSIGSDAIVFEKGGELFVLDLPGEKVTRVPVQVPSDKPATRAEYRNVSNWVGGWDLSPSGKRLAIEARGEIFSVPAEKGDVRDLTRSPGSRERDPSWSPDGKWIAYLSDRSGEYELHVIGGDGAVPDRQVTKGGGPFRFPPRFSPDSKKLAFSDKTFTLYWCDVESGKVTRVDKSEAGEIREFAWSGDSRFIAYSRPEANGLGSLRLYALEGGGLTTISSPMNGDSSPAFDPEGRWLFFISRRTFDLGAFAFDLNFSQAATDKIYAASLRADQASPVAPQIDEETGEAAGKDGEAKKGADAEDGTKGDKKAGGGKEAKGGAGGKDDKTAAPWKIDPAGIGSRVAEIPVAPGRYAGLAAIKGKVIYLAFDPPDPDGDGPTTGTIHYYDLEKREDKTIIAGVDGGFALSKDGSKLAYKAKETFGVIDVAEGKKAGDGKVAGAGNLMATVDPHQEWMQMFNEAWRLERDFYYDPAMGGLDWKGIGDHYRQLVPYVAHRADLNYILGELIGELGTSHTYVSGGDYPKLNRVGV